MDDRSESRLQVAQHLRHGVVLAVAWKLLAELFRRYDAVHDLRLLRSHPGISVAGRLTLYVDPHGGSLYQCKQLSLNLGGPTGTFEVAISGSTVTEGEFLWPALVEDPARVVDRLESLLRLERPVALPPSSPAVVTMRVMAEMLMASLMDRRGLLLEPAWYDWSGGSRVRPWASHFEVDVVGAQKRLDAGSSDWVSIYFSVSNLFRLCFESDGGGSATTSALFDLETGTLLMTQGPKVRKKIDVMDTFVRADRQVEPLAADSISFLRRHK